MKTIQRSHDMNWSGWTVILSLIPIVNLIIVAAIALPACQAYAKRAAISQVR